MTHSFLQAVHLKLEKLMFKHDIWILLAYQTKTDTYKWKVKGCGYNLSNMNCSSIRMLKFYDIARKKFHQMAFDFGYMPTEKRYGEKRYGIENAVYLSNDPKLEWRVLQKMCTLSNEGCSIYVGDVEVMKPYEGCKTLIDIDLESQSYAYLDGKAQFKHNVDYFYGT